MYAIPLEINRIENIILLLDNANRSRIEIAYATGKGKPGHESTEQAMVFPGVRRELRKVLSRNQADKVQVFFCIFSR